MTACNKQLLLDNKHFRTTHMSNIYENSRERCYDYIAVLANHSDKDN